MVEENGKRPDQVRGFSLLSVFERARGVSGTYVGNDDRSGEEGEMGQHRKGGG